MAMITLAEYTRRCGRNARYLRQKCVNGDFKTAQKVGRDWFVDEDEACPDMRVTTGKWVGYQRVKNRGKGENGEKYYHVRYTLASGGAEQEISLYAKTRADALALAINDKIPTAEGRPPIEAHVYAVTYRNDRLRMLKQASETEDE